jgi:hypothetical protein
MTPRQQAHFVKYALVLADHLLNRDDARIAATLRRLSGDPIFDDDLTVADVHRLVEQLVYHDSVLVLVAEPRAEWNVIPDNVM